MATGFLCASLYNSRQKKYWRDPDFSPWSCPRHLSPLWIARTHTALWLHSSTYVRRKSSKRLLECVLRLTRRPDSREHQRMPKTVRKRKPASSGRGGPKAGSGARGVSASGAARPMSLAETFKALEKVLALYSPPLKLWVSGSKSKPMTRLTVPMPVSIPGAYGSKPVDLEVASVIIETGFIGFYFMPLYLKPALKSKISPALRQRLRGKTCFHLKRADAATQEDVRRAVDLGTQLYRDRGWF